MNRRHLLYGLPLAVAAAGGVGFTTLLHRMQDNSYDPHALPSPLLGKRPPAFTLPGATGQRGFANTDLTGPLLVNWFASWCMVCPQEAPVLAQLAASGLPIWGIDYEDMPDALAQFLATNGNPYTRLAADVSGLTAINWGVYGVPETYLIDRAGIVRWRYAGALTTDLVTNTLNPLIAQYS
jgi:cytochrome c biogenesis protein CcmG/thiol:disulfide interchange protein DsbE